MGDRLIAQPGSLNVPVLVISRTSSSAAGTFMPVYSLRQFGSSFSSGPGSSTAPERACAPTAEAFSSTQMLISGLSCFRRMAQARPAGPAPTTTTSYSITSRSVMRCLSLRRHADRAVEADAFAIEHRVLADVRDQRRVFLRPAEARRERYLLAERVLHFLRKCRHHRRLEYAGRDRHHANAVAGEVARHRQRHADDAALGSGVGDLADLAVESSDRRCHHDHTALAFFVRRVVDHDARGRLRHEQRADQIHFDDLAENLTGERAFLVDHAARPADARAIHSDV